MVNFHTLAVAAVTCAASMATAAPFDLPTREGKHIDHLVPPGWAVEAVTLGDLDGDEVPDAVVVLLQEPPEADRKRALIVALQQADKRVVVGTNRGLLADYEGLGIKGGDASPKIEVARGVVVVLQRGGSRESFSYTHRFRLNKAINRMELIGFDETKVDDATGEKFATSTNYLTGDIVSSHTPPRRERASALLKTTSSKTRQSKRPLRMLEDVATADQLASESVHPQMPQ